MNVGDEGKTIGIWYLTECGSEEGERKFRESQVPMNKCIAIKDYVKEIDTAETKMLHSLHLDLKSHVLEKLNRNETCNLYILIPMTKVT